MVAVYSFVFLPRNSVHVVHVLLPRVLCVLAEKKLEVGTTNVQTNFSIGQDKVKIKGGEFTDDQVHQPSRDTMLTNILVQADEVCA